MKKLFLPLLLALFAACNVKFVDPALTERSATIKGQVVPSNAAVIYVRDGDSIAGGVDSATGEFEILVVPGNGEIVASAEGFGRYKSLRFVGKDGELELGTIWLPLEPFPISQIARPGAAEPQLFLIRFLEPMDTQSQGSVTTIPEVNGWFVWSDDRRTLSFYCHSTEIPENGFTVHVDTTARTQRGEVIEFAYTKEFTIPVLFLSSSFPPSGEIDFPAASEVYLRFSESISDSIIRNSISTKPSMNLAIRVSGSTIYARPLTGHWPFGTACTLLVAQGMRSIGGNRLETTARIVFQTERAAVSSVLPSHASSEVDIKASVRVVFPDTMDQQSAQQAFSLKDSSGTSVPGSFSWAPLSSGFTFTPNSVLQPGAVYRIAIDTGAQLTNGSRIQAYQSLFATSKNAPQIQILPADNEINVAPNRAISLSLPQKYRHTIEEVKSGFVLSDSTGSRIPGIFRLGSDNFTYTPQNQKLNTFYAIRVIVTDTVTQRLDTAVNVSYRTAPFRIDSISPGMGATSTLLSEGFRIATNNALDKLTVVPSVAVSPTLSCDFTFLNSDRVINVLPLNGFWPSDSAYTVTISPGSIKDVDGNTLYTEDSVFTFFTKPVVVTNHVPLNGTDQVSRVNFVALTFNTSMDTAATLGAFSVKDSSGAAHSGTRTWNSSGTVLTFSHAVGDSFVQAMRYTVALDTTARDSYGKKMPTRFTAQFRTGND